MYGLDPATDLSPLVACELTFVGVGLHQVQLGFSSGDGRDSSISVEGEFSASVGGGAPTTFAKPIEGATVLVRLLGKRIDSASVSAPGTVRLIFDDESRVEVFDSSSDYESYQLNLAGREIIV